jgi:hypothetical protein
MPFFLKSVLSLELLGFWTLSIVRHPKKLENTTFRKMGFCPYVRVRVTLRLAVYRQPVRLGDKPLETHDRVILFTITAGPRQRSHSQIRVPRDS